ncbi:MAG TPA: CARDB domain-containing protein [Ignavibacteria bacterium]|nr:CARDB domain-containing protein [Ignavibacteria bacterium]HMR39312.1 CARDB domain-containing protein [Ignavibacteria bacterium]
MNNLNFYRSLIFLSLLLISSCCIFQSDPPDLRITGQNYPGTVNANQRFDLEFIVGNFSSGDCDAETSSQGVVNLKLINRATGVVQVNDTETLNGLSNNSNQMFTFSVVIGPEGTGTYDLIFVVDPNNTTGDTDRNNNTQTGTIVVN